MEKKKQKCRDETVADGAIWDVTIVNDEGKRVFGHRDCNLTN